MNSVYSRLRDTLWLAYRQLLQVPRERLRRSLGSSWLFPLMLRFVNVSDLIVAFLFGSGKEDNRISINTEEIRYDLFSLLEQLKLTY